MLCEVRGRMSCVKSEGHVLCEVIGGSVMCCVKSEAECHVLCEVRGRMSCVV